MNHLQNHPNIELYHIDFIIINVGADLRVCPNDTGEPMNTGEKYFAPTKKLIASKIVFFRVLQHPRYCEYQVFVCCGGVSNVPASQRCQRHQDVKDTKMSKTPRFLLLFPTPR